MEAIVECRVCGKQFKTTHPRQCYCSPECATIGRKEVVKAYFEKPGMLRMKREKDKERYDKKRWLIARCEHCGSILPKNRKLKLCDKCVVDMYMNPESPAMRSRAYQILIGRHGSMQNVIRKGMLRK